MKVSGINSRYCMCWSSLTVLCSSASTRPFVGEARRPVSLTSHMSYATAKAGLKIRNAWQIYSKIEKEYGEIQSPDLLDVETRTALQFGVGMFNLVCSVLPPRILRLVAFFGFPTEWVKSSHTMCYPFSQLASLIYLCDV